MIDCSEKRKRQLVLELQSSRVYEKRSKRKSSGGHYNILHFLLYLRQSRMDLMSFQTID